MWLDFFSLISDQAFANPSHRDLNFSLVKNFTNLKRNYDLKKTPIKEFALAVVWLAFFASISDQSFANLMIRENVNDFFNLSSTFNYWKIGHRNDICPNLKKKM